MRVLVTMSLVVFSLFFPPSHYLATFLEQPRKDWEKASGGGRGMAGADPGNSPLGDVGSTDRRLLLVCGAVQLSTPPLPLWLLPALLLAPVDVLFSSTGGKGELSFDYKNIIVITKPATSGAELARGGGAARSSPAAFPRCVR